MIAFVFKRAGARTFTARVQLPHEAKLSNIPLGCTTRPVAEKKLREIVEEKEREAAGIIAPKVQREAAVTLLGKHLGEMLATKSQSKDDLYLCNLKGRVLRLISECGWKFPKDVSPESFEAWRSRQTLSVKSLNDYLTSSRTLLNWMEKHNRITFNPLRSVDLLPDDGSKRRPRRALSDEEFAKLVVVSGERGTAYLIAATTGLRFGEINEVERGDVFLEGDSPKIVARATTTKNRKEASLHLHADVVEPLRSLLETKEMDSKKKVFAPFFRKRGQFKQDLQAAGIAPLDEAGRVVDSTPCATLSARIFNGWGRISACSYISCGIAIVV